MPEIKFVGKLYEGKLHVRFDEGSGESHCLLYICRELLND
jgi:hypothetical protein